MRLIIIVFFILLASFAKAETFNVGPSDCSAHAVNNAISAAKDGDIVELTCVGTVIWDSTVTIPDNKGITVRVVGGTNTPKEFANFPLTILSSADPIMYVNCDDNNSLARVSGFKFTNNIASSYGAVYVKGRGTGKNGLGAYRIDNNYFDEIQLPYASLEGTVTLRSTMGVMTGLLDNNTFHDCSYTDGYTIAVTEMWKDGGDNWSYAGNNAWGRNFSFGDNDFVFIEDNLIENIDRYTRHMVMGHSGAKYVIRYNKFDIRKNNNGILSQIIDGHGLCLCRHTGQGTRGGEIYNNVFSSGSISLHNTMLLRGGTWLAFDNTFENRSVSALGHIALLEYRAGSSGMRSQCTTTCDAITPWFSSVTDSSKYPLEQQVMGSYFWNNAYGGSLVSPIQDTDGVQSSYIQKNRDFYDCVDLADAKSKGLSSGYKPYTYPHPLREESSQVQIPEDFKKKFN